MGLVADIKDRISGKVPKGSKRSNQWPKVRAAHLKDNASCALCGGKKKLEVHHIHPFHLHPELELDPKNLITLCESKANGINCHLFFGHLGNFKGVNPQVPKDALEWAARILERLKAESEK